jgi:dUTPase
MKIHIVSHSKHPLPAYETAASAGMDLRASLSSEISLLFQPGYSSNCLSDLKHRYDQEAVLQRKKVLRY